MLARDTIIKDIGRLVFWYPVRWLVLLLPFSSLYRLGGILGFIDFYVSGRRRIERMQRNIEAACAPGMSAKLTMMNRQNHFRNVLELIRYPGFSPEQLARFVRFSGIDFLDNELARGRGVMLVTAHFGAKQLLQIALGMKGYKVSQINHHMTKEDLSYIQKRVSQRHRLRIEEKLPVRFLSASGFMRGSYQCLMDKEVLIVAGDGTGIRAMMDTSYRPFTFLNKQMLFPTNNFSLARRTGASIIPVFVVRQKGVSHILFSPPLEQGGTRDSMINRYVQVLERTVRSNPDQWEFWEEFDENVLLSN